MEEILGDDGQTVSRRRHRGRRQPSSGSRRRARRRARRRRRSAPPTPHEPGADACGEAALGTQRGEPPELFSLPQPPQPRARCTRGTQPAWGHPWQVCCIGGMRWDTLRCRGIPCDVVGYPAMPWDTLRCRGIPCAAPRRGNSWQLPNSYICLLCLLARALALSPSSSRIS